MKEDYLWDKTGTDPEIEKLENALAVFRYKETAPPALPAKILPFEKQEAPPRSFIRYAFAAAACLAFVAISIGVWFQISNSKFQISDNKTVDEIEFVEIIAPKIAAESQTESSASGDKQIEVSKQIIKHNIVKVKRRAPLVARNKTFTARKPKPDKLTKEEKYAYDQLMLALSITSSKLKIVKDKIENIENQNAVITKER